jgi:hypothetical protein
VKPPLGIGLWEATKRILIPFKSRLTAQYGTETKLLDYIAVISFGLAINLGQSRFQEAKFSLPCKWMTEAIERFGFEVLVIVCWTSQLLRQ